MDDLPEQSEAIDAFSEAVEAIAPPVEDENQTIDYQELVNTLIQTVQGVGDDSLDEVSENGDSVADSFVDESDTVGSVSIIQNVNDLDASEAVGAMVPARSSGDLPQIGIEEPDNLLFYGSVWVQGVDDTLGDITVYFPNDTKNSWGLDRTGRLVYVGSDSSSGYLAGVYNNSLSVSSFSAPRYRLTNSANYSYLSLVPSNSNADIAVASAPRVSMLEALPLVAVGLLGVIVLFLGKSRH